ncbi:MAG TPA: branched-chain amino acid ABC transporter substrate-binding protein [Candidatus Dormibacteraeota bacterium]
MVALAGCNGLLNSQPHVVGTVKLAADLPLSGDDAPDGVPVKDALELAIKQRSSVCGASSHQDACLRVELAPYDDVSKGIHDPAQGAGNVRLMTTDPQVIAMVGPLYDSLARSEIPIANRAHLAVVSPANTNECLTQVPADGHCLGLAAQLRPDRTNSYFRVVTTALMEAPAAAEFAVRTLHARHAFVVDDATPVGKALNAAFATRFRSRGGTIAASIGSADVVFFPGADINAAAALRRQLAGATPAIPLLAGDALANDQYAKAAGSAARGSYYAAAGAWPPAIKAAAGFITDYGRAYGQPPTGISLQAFDAANLVLDAVRRAIDDAGGSQPSRQQVLAEVAQTTSYQGLMGPIGFDPQGDTTLRWVGIYQWTAPSETSGAFVAEIDVS